MKQTYREELLSSLKTSSKTGSGQQLGKDIMQADLLRTLASISGAEAPQCLVTLPHAD